MADGSDHTAEIASRIAETNKHVKVISSPTRLGKGKAFYIGAQQTPCDTIFLIDTDLPVPLRYIQYFQDRLWYSDVVIATRYNRMSIVDKQPLTRKLESWTYRKLTNWLLATNISDYQCGFKAFNREPLMQIIPEMKITGWGFDTELLHAYIKKGYSIEEIPVTYQHGKGSKVSAKTVLNMLDSLLFIYANQK